MGFSSNSLDYLNKLVFPPETIIITIFHPTETKYLLSISPNKLNSITKELKKQGRVCERLNSLHFKDFSVFLHSSESLIKAKRFFMVLFAMGLSWSLCAQNPEPCVQQQLCTNAFDSLCQSIQFKLK